MFIRCSGWILPYCYVVAGDSGWLPQRWYMVGKVLRVNFLRLSLHLCDFSPALWTHRWKCCIGSLIKIIPHFFSTTHMIWGMIHVWSYILSVRGLLKSIDFLSMHVIFWVTSISKRSYWYVTYSKVCIFIFCEVAVVEIHGFGCSPRPAVTFTAVLNQYLEFEHHICRRTRCAEPPGICVELRSIRP